MQFHIETDDPEGFVQRYEMAFSVLSRVAAEGSEEEQVARPEIEAYRSFFGDSPSPEEAARQLSAWQAMSEDERRAYESEVRWDIQNLLYMLGPEMRTWEMGESEITGPSSVVLSIQENESPSATGAIRQIVEYAGGKLVEPPQPPRSGLFSFFKR